MYIDSHSHFDITAQKNHRPIEELIANLKENQISRAVQVAVSADQFETNQSIAKKFESSGIYATLGIHPSSPMDEKELSLLQSTIEKLMLKPPQWLLGIGECGLDYYRLKQPKDKQKACFQLQIQLAAKHGLPLIIHIRDAMDDALDILKNHAPLKGILHCFSGTTHDMEKAVEMGFYISFAGNVTYKNALALQEAAKAAPFDRILLETDAPFLTPMPLRGKSNYSEYVIYTYDFIAKLRGISLTTLCERINHNFTALLNTRRGVNKS
ncbi:MAG: TatD family hydrolase [Spirochaetales bacterium]|nr:TatD family hydrolase [Spirochaetales bacterium]